MTHSNETLLIAAAIILTLLAIWYLKWKKVSEPKEHLTTFASALVSQERKLENPVEQFKTPEEIVKNALAQKRFELMSSSQNNSDDPLQAALAGGSVVNAM